MKQRREELLPNKPWHAWHLNWVHENLPRLDGLLTETTSRYGLRDAPSFADCLRQRRG